MKDAQARDRIGPWSPDGAPRLDAFDPDTNFVVQAAAGSGKTTALVARMVALVRSGVPVDDLAAITFTRKAAGEMNERFFTELQQAHAALDATGRTVQRDRVDDALDDLQRCFIGTIHAFCGRLLRERPIDAGLPPDFTSGIDERDERELRERAWSRYLADTWRDDRDAFERLGEAGLAPDDLLDFFGDLCRVPELEPFTDGPAEVPDLSEAVAETHAFLDRWLAERPVPPVDTSPGAALEAFDTADRFRTYRDLSSPATQAAYLDLFSGLLKKDARKSTDTDERGNVKKKAWGDNRDAADRLDNEALPAFVQGTIRPAMRTWHAFVHRVAVDFVQPAVDRFTTLRRQEGQLTFQDLLLSARDLLRDHPSVRRHFQSRFPRLLVDEFQDTDPIQAELLFYLTADDPDETDWRACRPHPGSLFIVGDDKQSIYRFRRADMTVFQSVGALVDDAGGEQVELTTNFRSVAPICDWCNTAFQELYSDPDLADVQANYVDFEPHRDAGDDPLPVRQLRIEKQRGNYPDAIAEADADAIARVIQSDCTSSGDGSAARSYGDFMILTRLSKRLGVYAEALSARGIPYTITGSKDLDTSPELRALVDLLTCVERPDDPVARVAYLRGRLVGLSDDALFRYRTASAGDEGFSSESLKAPRGLLKDNPHLHDAIARAGEQVNVAESLLNRHAPAAAFEKLMDRLGLWAMASHPTDGAGDGSLRAGRLVRVLVLVQHYDAQGLHWTRIREELQRVLDGDETVDGMTLETGAEDAVRLMNVHQAKGLQAPTVFLADPYDRYHNPEPRLHVRREEGDVLLPVARRFGPGRSVEKGAPAAWQETYADEEMRHHDAEERRLQYVAATRAKDRLVVSRYEAKDDGFWADLYRFLDEAGVDDLDVPTDEALPARASAVDTIPSLDAARGRRRRRTHTVSKRGYVLDSLRPEDVEVGASFGGSDGRGREYGRVVHRLLESLAEYRNDADARTSLLSPSLVRHLFVQEHDTTADADRLDDDVQFARAAATSFLDSRLWDDVKAADAVRTEWPIARFVSEDDATAGIDASDAEDAPLRDGAVRVEQGVVDLAYRTERGWTLVDYKTDLSECTSAADVPSTYWSQLDAYARAWEDEMAQPVAETILWDTETGRQLQRTSTP